MISFRSLLLNKEPILLLGKILFLCQIRMIVQTNIIIINIYIVRVFKKWVVRIWALDTAGAVMVTAEDPMAVVLSF